MTCALVDGRGGVVLEHNRHIVATSHPQWSYIIMAKCKTCLIIVETRGCRQQVGFVAAQLELQQRRLSAATILLAI